MRQSLRNQPAIRTSNFMAMNFYGKNGTNCSWQIFLDVFSRESTSKSTFKKQDDRCLSISIVYVIQIQLTFDIQMSILVPHPFSPGARTSKELDDFRRRIPRICLIFGKIQFRALLASSSSVRG